MGRRVPLSGEPDFCSVDDSTLKVYESTIQRLLFAYPARFYPDQNRVLNSIWHDVSCESTKRLVDSADSVPVSRAPKPLTISRKLLVKTHKVI